MIDYINSTDKIEKEVGYYLSVLDNFYHTRAVFGENYIGVDNDIHLSKLFYEDTEAIKERNYLTKRRWSF